MSCRLALRALLTFALLTAASVQAQPAGSQGNYFIYHAQPGDTLIKLAETYTYGSQAWRQLQTLNQVDDPYQMPVGMTLRIPLSLIPRAASRARLIHVSGSVHISNASARTDALLTQGHTLSTSDDSYATIALEDGSLITLPPNTDVRLDQINTFRGTDLTDIVVDMPRGSLEAIAAPAGGGVGRFEVRTPVAVTGVRGTRFRIHHTDEGQTNTVTNGSVQLQPRSGAFNTPTLLRAGYGVVVRNNGTFAGSWPLLPAPAISAPVLDAGKWLAHITPVEGAVAYEVIVSRDPAGYLRVSSVQTQDTEVRIAPGLNRYYLSVRAIDEQGLRGHDTRLSILPDNVLLDNRGEPVMSGADDKVLLTDY